MEEIQQQQKEQYKFEEFEEHLNLFNIVPAGDGKSLDLLRVVTDGIQSGHFDKKPSILIAGDGSINFAIAMANTLCPQELKICDAHYLLTTKDQMDFFGETLPDTIHIIQRVEKMGINESVLWNYLKNRFYKFKLSYDCRLVEYIYLNGMIIIVAQDIQKVSQAILDSTDFKVVIEPYSQKQIEMIVRQRLKFCGIYEQNNEVITTILEYACGGLKRIIEILRICVLLVSQEGKKCLTMELVQKAVNLAFLPSEL